MIVSQRMTKHALVRSRTRVIRLASIEAALLYGSVRRARGAEIFTVGWRDVLRWGDLGLDIARHESVQVVCASDGSVMTVYRNRQRVRARARARR